MDIEAGFPETMHGVRVLRNSIISDKAKHRGILAARLDGSEIQEMS